MNSSILGAAGVTRGQLDPAPPPTPCATQSEYVRLAPWFLVRQPPSLTRNARRALGVAARSGVVGLQVRSGTVPLPLLSLGISSPRRPPPRASRTRLALAFSAYKVLGEFVKNAHQGCSPQE